MKKEKNYIKLVIVILIISIIILFIAYLISPTKIVLIGKDEMNITYNTEYEEPGVYAKKLFFRINKEILTTQNIDSLHLGKYIVEYQIKDTDIKKQRIINVIDDEKPKIVLDGSEYTMFKGEEYIEPGYSAIDNLNGDLTEQVIITDNIKSEELGEYKVEYKICDSNNNCAEATRKINIIKGDVLYGNFRNSNVDSYYQPTLKLRGYDRTFELKVNLCEGMGLLKGTYTVNGNDITLTVTEKLCSGYIGIDEATYKFSIVEEDTLRYDSNYIVCSPQPGDLFVKYR